MPGIAVPLVLCALGCGADATSQPPNLLLVTIDTLRADHVSAYGYPRRTTPAIDRMAARGVRFRDVIVQRGETWPSLTSFLTATHPRTHGVRNNGQVVEQGPGSLAVHLREEGFATAAFLCNMTTAPHPGFDHLELWGAEEWAESGHFSVDRMAVEAASAWMTAHAGERFFVWVHLIGPHDPYEVPPGRSPRFATAYDGDLDGSRRTLVRVRSRRRVLTDAELAHVVSLYDEDVAGADENAGRLLDALERIGLEGRTLVALTSDHGEELYDHDFYFFHSLSIHGSVLRVPLVLRWPGRLPEGRVVDGLVESVDLAPTLLPLLGVATPAHFEGVDLADRIAGSDGGRLDALAELGPEIHSLRTDRWSYIYNPKGFTSPGGSERDPGNRGWFRMPGEQLYDLRADPREQENLAGDRPDVAARLRERLLARVGSGSSPSPAPIPASTEAELRALGYLGDDPEEARERDR